MKFEPGKRYVILVNNPYAADQTQRHFRELMSRGGGCMVIWGAEIIEQEQLHAIHPDVAYIPGRNRPYIDMERGPTNITCEPRREPRGGRQ